MLSKTKGIVLHSTKYSDSSSIVTIYTELYGRSSYMVRVSSKNKSGTKPALFQPLTLIEIDVFHNPSKEIHSIKEVRIDIPLIGIYTDVEKNAIALFMAEVLFRSIKLSTPDEQLYNFISQSVQVLDCTHELPANFHLIFMLKLTRFLGFEPNISETNSTYFDLMNGISLSSRPIHTHYIAGEQVLIFEKLCLLDYFDMSGLSLSRTQRTNTLKALIEYYRLHINGFHGLNSLAVLQSIFD
ncbi:MAG: DNA repair protein RecO [Paludibacter sp.]